METPARPWVWTPARLQAAADLADDRLSDEKIASSIGRHRSTLARWKRHPVFAAKVKELVDESLDALNRAVRAEMDRRWETAVTYRRQRRRSRR